MMTVHTPTSTAEALLDLREALGDRILLDEETRSAFRSDFGRLVDRLPGAVARCRSAAEVAEVVRFCRERKIPIVSRGQGHTQTGQATTEGGVLLDTSSLRTIHEIDEAAEVATVDGGVVWRELVQASLE
jgi:cytokinin dehydrogenase